ncbi:MAG: lipoyl(octanoyl) transferase LipB [Verrucomicrobiales bacterium]
MIDRQDLGRDRDFRELWTHQESLLLARREGKIADTLLLLEHQPVYTIGRTRDQSSLGSSAHLPHPVVEINRGGQATYHGPGQLTGYAIIDLNQYERDLHAHLRRLEEGLIRLLATYEVTAERREGLTGVWIGPRKIASLGVGVRRWITMHGFAINITAESEAPFQHITPCGLDGVSMTSLESESGTRPDMGEVKRRCGEIFNDIFSAPGH